MKEERRVFQVSTGHDLTIMEAKVLFSRVDAGLVAWLDNAKPGCQIELSNAGHLSGRYISWIIRDYATVPIGGYDLNRPGPIGSEK